MDIADWRVKIDELDRQLVELISERARCAVEIGKLKQNSSLPVYEPDRERIIFDNIARQNKGPLSQVQLRQIYERLVDVMRQIQKDEMAPQPVEERPGEATEMEPRDCTHGLRSWPFAGEALGKSERENCYQGRSLTNDCCDA